MACFHPLDAWQTESGQIVFAERGDIRRALQLPCGQCIGCRLARSRVWATRCMCEVQMHDRSSFLTLTYSDEHCPRELIYSHFQKFMKRLRFGRGPCSVCLRRNAELPVEKQVRCPRFYMCGEYGENFGRPHFHAVLFGVWFDDAEVFQETSAGFRLYRSSTLEKLWPFGFASFGEVTFDSAAYVARYCVKKVSGRDAETHYERVDAFTGEIYSIAPEFGHMSLKPGIGAGWVDEFSSDLQSGSFILQDGREQTIPKFFMDRMPSVEAQEIEFERWRKSLDLVVDTPDRLAVREVVAHARLNLKKRSL